MLQNVPGGSEFGNLEISIRGRFTPQVTDFLSEMCFHGSIQ